MIVFAPLGYEHTLITHDALPQPCSNLVSLRLLSKLVVLKFHVLNRCCEYLSNLNLLFETVV
ncbi:hypothetical protein HanRHA438_Chr11g0516441 [Helianthus annuus]|uniref:Uncharacterized protein n=1 Tax=Helianthus annuus TaxID=4232 RepID=A0A9K3N1J2_HELAN|nr:hypothetical protein HanXRQr2_Chr11g0503801 [Helianthus annuus]KAF5783084.1 hypothetical protein HanXRQr2_Chr11g0503811 [Helianthus annuus]KAJ0502495.1 hypothetical protein HanHA300_Chr11g0413581 [Helianthus annuus]KAJ0510570.1 hypothetical protein HanIR_Chr11g0542291 [Helianthus annuus]KAJ0510571.1 hypothetical protein HanIR_Chr11g0542301 [Helianthus annuus]